MKKYTHCPQCGNELYTDHYTQTHCVMCSWGKTDEPYTPPPTGIIYTLSSKSLKWKTTAFAGVIVCLLIITPVLNLAINQVQTNRAIAKARQQIDKGLYASAARTLNQAPRTVAVSSARKEVSGLLSNSIRWARDTSEVNVAKKQVAEVEPEFALNTLDDIEEDFPLEDEAVDLIDFAQEQALDPSLEVNEEMLDELANMPDDPELGNLDELEQEAGEQLTPDAPKPAAASSAPAPAPAIPEEPATPEEGVISDELIEEPPLDELPEAPEMANEEESNPTTPAPKPDPASADKQTPRLATLYHMSWQNKPTNQTDQDNFYTIDLNNEVNARKDRLSNFSGYGSSDIIGQLYTRKPEGKKNIVPLYRYWSVSKTDHYYTVNSKFASKTKKSNYVRQQAAGYIGKWDGKKCSEGITPLYTLYNAKVSDNFYTTNAAMKDALVKNQGWTNPKVVGCIW